MDASAPTPPVAHIEGRIERLAGESLSYVGALGVVLYTGYFVLNALHFPEALRTPILVHDAVVAGISAAVWLYTRRGGAPRPASLWLTVLCWVFLSNILLATYLRQESWYDYYLILLLVGTGAVFVHRLYLGAFLVGGLLAWLALAVSMDLEPSVGRRLPMILGAAVSSALINHLRVRWLCQMETLRSQAEQQSAELEVALDAARSELDERRKTEDALKASESRFRELFERLVDGIAILDAVEGDFVVRTLNRVVPSLDPPRLIGKHLGETFSRLRRSGLWPQLEAAAVHGTEARELGVEIEFAGDTYFLDYLVFRLPTGEVVMLFKNRSDEVAAAQDRAVMQKKLLQNQKLESLGILAGGIAHDFNNLLMGMLANAEAASARLDEHAFVSDCLGDIKIASKNAAGLCRQLLAYAGQGHVASNWVDPNAIIRGLDALIDSAAKHARLVLEIDERPIQVQSDGDQLGQVLLNLISNAADANARVITVRTEVRELGPQTLRKAAVGQNLVPGTFHLLTVRDDGEGIAEEDLTRIFDPFFSTRFTGRGLGLSAVAGIVGAHGGAVFVESTIGLGAEFTVAFPTAPPEPLIAAVPAVTDAPINRPHVLLVDDDLTARRSVRRLLELDNVLITEASDGEEALEVAGSRGDVFDLVLLDLTMPRRGGVETFPDLAETLPRARIVIMSGYDAQADAVGALTDHPRFGGFLAKPYTLSSLRQVVSGESAEP